MGFLREYWNYLKATRSYWIWSIIIALLMFGGVVALTAGTAAAPFTYFLF